MLDFLGGSVVLLLSFLTPSPQAKDKMQGWLFLDVIITECSSIFKLFASKNQSLLIRRNAWQGKGYIFNTSLVAYWTTQYHWYTWQNCSGSGLMCYYFSLLNFINFRHGKIFLCWSRKEDLRYSISKLGHKITKVHVCKILWFLRKRNHITKCHCDNDVCGCFEQHSTGKWQKNLFTVYMLFDHWNTAPSSDFHHLKTLVSCH